MARLSLRRAVHLATLVPVLLCSLARAQAQDYLADNTVLIVRHAEKPPEEAVQPRLTVQGQHRAEAYARYFRPWHEGATTLQVTALYAGADSAGSVRPRLTLEPLSRASGLSLDSTVGTKNPEALVTLLHTLPHGLVPLICWRHGQIPRLLAALGVSPEALLPAGKWPDDTFDWVLVVHFDAHGHPTSQQLVHESLAIPESPGTMAHSVSRQY